MKRLMLCSINSRYIHTNLAVRYIAAYVRERYPHIPVAVREWTISRPLTEIVREIIVPEGVFISGNGTRDTSRESPCAALFSVYIWNTELTFKVMRELKKLRPGIILGAGGPEVSWQAEKLLEREPVPDFIMQGEGEATAAEAVHALEQARNEDMREALLSVPGIWMRSNGEPVFSGQRELIADLDSVPFPYGDPFAETYPANPDDPENIDPENQIAYYESSRGCPFRCSYCLSSLDKNVRYFSPGRVYRDLAFFLRNNFRLVKFTDRTFNLDPQRYTGIWRYIAEHWNGVTTFHFEISAAHLCEQAYGVMEQIPRGAVQFEIGIQSVHPETLRRIGRTGDFAAAAANTLCIPRGIHVHLDLIAGLPGEDIGKFRESFDKTVALRPHMLQLGFLKILSGTAMETYAREHGFISLSVPPYEVLSTPDLPYSDMLILKDIEHLFDICYNSGLFSAVMSAAVSICSRGETLEAGPASANSVFDFFASFAACLRSENILYPPKKTADYFGYLAGLFRSNPLMTELLRFDFISMGKTGRFPGWYDRSRYDKHAHEKALREHTDIPGSRERYARSDYDVFDWNPFTFAENETKILFLYEKDIPRHIVL